MQALPNIPGYELYQRLGGGPLTSVFSARDCGSDSACAVKVIRDDWEDRTTAIKLLQREARAGLAVEHPHIVRFLHAHVTRSPYYLVMELLPGESLRRRLRRDYRLDVPTALWIMRQTAEALAALHKAGFLHGDVKPDNIRLVNDGTASLIDLGFAHRPGENDHFFQKGYILGTVNYLCPELCRDQPSETLNSDIFSLGVTFYEMLSGQLPFPSGDLEQVFAQRCTNPPDDIRRHVKGVSSTLVGLLERLMARDPADRPRAAAVVQQLVALEIATLKRRRSA
jgi:serine/threonine protein kinase